ncbi:unnamed protein product [Acanthosepion pharaonis]|uniref:Uncharacterized protein n=1 Tax=Acanthosepion pharaonis TaxID=158019 RepID=A0A812EZQ5_ACAPH|nr:unnamed protein product [Sepia pharaonis]
MVHFLYQLPVPTWILFPSPSASFVVKPPKIQITRPTFSGLEMADDHMSSRKFLTRFENCWLAWPMTLKCSLSDRALRLINHLSCTDANYRRALSVLKREYLDIDEIMDQIFQYILDYVPKRDTCCSDLGEFISRTASLLEELGNFFSCGFSADDSGEARLMAKIVFQKISKELKEGMIGLTGKGIPSLSAILELTNKAVKRLRVKGGASAASTFTTGQGSYQKTARRATVTSSFHVDSNNLTSAGYSRSLPSILLVTFFRGEKTGGS